MRLPWAVLVGVVLACTLTTAAQTFTSFDDPSGTWTEPTAIGKNGGIIGMWQNASTSTGGMFFRNGKGVFLNIKNPGRYEPYAINSAGTVIGNFGNGWDQGYYGGFVRSSSGTITRYHAARIEMFLALNDAGVVVGMNGLQNPPGPTAWIGTPPTFSAMVSVPSAVNLYPKAINNGNTVAGYYRDTNYREHGFVWNSTTGATSFDVANSNYTTIFTLDDNGYFAGVYSDQTGAHCFVVDGNGFTSFDTPNGTLCELTARNQNGTIAGNYNDSISHGYYRTSQGAITTVDYPGATGTWLCGINAVGTLVGYYIDTDGNQHGFSYKP